MKYFPVYLHVENKRVVICGGGELAHRKAIILARTVAELVILAEEINSDIQDMVDSGQAQHVKHPEPELFENAAIVLVGTGDREQDVELRNLAKSAGALVNVVDRPELSDTIFPSIIDRSPLVIAVGTEGASPILARRVRARIDVQLPPDLGKTARRSGAMRGHVKRAFNFFERRQFWEWALKKDLMTDDSVTDDEAAERLIAEYKTLDAHKSDTVISVISAPHGLYDLLTLRAVQRLQDADAIIYDEDVDYDYIDLARRDAEFAAISTLAATHDRLAEVFKESNGMRRTVYLTTQDADAVIAQARDIVSEQDLKLVISDLS